MIVDLLRNDLGKVAVPGSVRVSSLFDLERFRDRVADDVNSRSDSEGRYKFG
jgi:anthranilate/para-aminobenzoate synthase component I